jgi:antitoxin HigA-1
MSKSQTTTDSQTPILNLPPIHPGEILGDEMTEISVSANALARDLDVPPNRITEILNGKRSITADTALRLSCYFKTSAKFWLNLQMSYDLAIAELKNGKEIITRVRGRAA